MMTKATLTASNSDRNPNPYPYPYPYRYPYPLHLTYPSPGGLDVFFAEAMEDEEPPGPTEWDRFF